MHGGAVGEHQLHRRYPHGLVAGEVVARVEDGRAGRPLVPVPAHGAPERRPQRRVGARGQAAERGARVDDGPGRRRERGRGHLDRPAGDHYAGEVEVVGRRVLAGDHLRELRVRTGGGSAEGQVPRGARRRRKAVGEGRAVPGRHLRRQRRLPEAEAQEPVDLAEGPGVAVAAPEDEARDRVGRRRRRRRRQRQRVAREVTDGVRVVVVGDLVGTILVVVRRAVARRRRRGELLALPRAAGYGGVRGRRGGVEDRVALLVAVRARLALDPRLVAAGVELHHQFRRRRAEAERGDVVGGAERFAPVRQQGHAALGLIGRRSYLAPYGVDSVLVSA